MQHTDIENLFQSADGEFRFARWGRPIAPVAFGVEDQTVQIVKGAAEAVAMASGHKLIELDPELGSNLWFIFFSDWDELAGVKDLDQLLPELDGLIGRLQEADAQNYRLFRFDPDGAIKACFVFLRMDAATLDLPADLLILDHIVQSFLLWGDDAFAGGSTLTSDAGGDAILRPDVAAILRAAYDPVLPNAGNDPVLALRLAARIAAGQQDA